MRRAGATALADYDLLRVGFVEPAGREIRLHRPGRADQAVELLRDGEPVAGAAAEAAVDQIVEVAVPFDALGVAVDGPVQFFVEVLQGGQSPRPGAAQGAIALSRPSPDFELIMWHV